MPPDGRLQEFRASPWGWRETRPYAIPSTTGGVFLHPWSHSKLNRSVFFDEIRRGIFHGRLSASQVANIEVLLETWDELYPEADRRWIANSLAQVWHETGGRMTPVRETFAASDALAQSRLETAWRRGRLPWVRSPYWRDGAFGRGYLQITHWPNYRRVGERIGVDLRAHPELLLVPEVSAKASVAAMVEGWFTGKKLADYFNERTDDPLNARRIVNGKDGTDARVAAVHHRFLSALDGAA